MELLEATDNKNYIKANSSGINYLYPIKAPKASDENVFTLLELISCFPDLNNEFRLWQESEISYLKVDSLNFIEEDKIIELKISKLNELFLESLFPKAYYDILEIDGDKIKIECKNDSRPNITQIYSGAFDIGDASVVNSFKDNTGLNTICSLYAMSYFLGMLARYYPSVWIGLKRGEKGDKIYPMINKMLNFIDEKFPEIITDFLGAPYEFENKDGY